MDANWEHAATIVDGEKYEIDSVDIWSKEWIDANERISITDPIYGRKYNFTIYKIKTPEKQITFAAGEFSNCVWGIYRLKN